MEITPRQRRDIVETWKGLAFEVHDGALWLNMARVDARPDQRPDAYVHVTDPLSDVLSGLENLVHRSAHHIEFAAQSLGYPVRVSLTLMDATLVYEMHDALLERTHVRHESVGSSRYPQLTVTVSSSGLGVAVRATIDLFDTFTHVAQSHARHIELGDQ